MNSEIFICTVKYYICNVSESRCSRQGLLVPCSGAAHAEHAERTCSVENQGFLKLSGAAQVSTSRDTSDSSCIWVWIQFQLLTIQKPFTIVISSCSHISRSCTIGRGVHVTVRRGPLLLWRMPVFTVGIQWLCLLGLCCAPAFSFHCMVYLD